MSLIEVIIVVSFIAISAGLVLLRISPSVEQVGMETQTSIIRTAYLSTAQYARSRNEPVALILNGIGQARGASLNLEIFALNADLSTKSELERIEIEHAPATNSNLDINRIIFYPNSSIAFFKDNTSSNSSSNLILNLITPSQEKKKLTLFFDTGSVLLE